MNNRFLCSWKTYHETLSQYRNQPLPSVLDYENSSRSGNGEECIAVIRKNRDIFKANQRIEEIIYIVTNESKIEKTIECLLQTFNFSREEIESNISFYDIIFGLPESVVLEKTKQLIELLGSKENFLSAIRCGPLENLEVNNPFNIKRYRGIMSYKKIQLLEDKIISLSKILSLSREDAIKVFVSDYRYIYASPKTTKDIIAQWCSMLNTTPEEIGVVLRDNPCFLSNRNLQEKLDKLKNCFSLSTDEAAKIIISYPKIVNAPFWDTYNILRSKGNNLPSIVIKRPWLYRIQEVIVDIYHGYGYGDYQTILNFLAYVERTIGEIIDVKFGRFNPRIREKVRSTHEVIYTTLIVKKHGTENEHCFVSLGSGYGTCNKYKGTEEEQLLQMMCGYRRDYLAEFIVDAPPINSKEYETMLLYVFYMSSTGNALPCDCALKNGTSIVVEKLENTDYAQLNHDNFYCTFHTLKIIPTNNVPEYKEKYTKKVVKNPPGFDFEGEWYEDLDEDLDLDLEEDALYHKESE